MISRLKSPYLLLVFVAILWAGNIVVSKKIIYSLPPFTLSMIRFLLASVLLLPWLLRKKSFTKLRESKAFYRLLFMAVTGVLLFNSFLYSGLRFTSAINASFVNSLSPLAIFILSVFWLKEEITYRQILGLIVSFLGVLWIVSQGNYLNIINMQLNIGDIFVFAGCFTWALYSNMAKVVMRKIPPMETAALGIVIGTVFLIPASIFELQFFKDIEISWVTAVTIAYLVVFASIVATALWFDGINKVGAARAANYYNLIPIFSIIMAVIFLKEELFTYHYIGGILVFSGLYLSSAVPPKKKFTN